MRSILSACFYGKDRAHNFGRAFFHQLLLQQPQRHDGVETAAMVSVMV